MQDNGFAEYMRALLREKGVEQKVLFRETGIPERYGYRLISTEKHTRQRDLILKLCIGAGFTIEETDRALLLYGMAPLREWEGRDAELIALINEGIRDVYEISECLERVGYARLYEPSAGNV